MNTNNVYTRLKSERTRLKIGQAEIAKDLDVHLKTVGRWETEIAIPADKLEVLAAMGFDVTYIVTGKKLSDMISILDDDLKMLTLFQSSTVKQRSLILNLVYVVASPESAVDEFMLNLYRVRNEPKTAHLE